MIEVKTLIDSVTPRGARSSFWFARCAIDGRSFEARSQHGAVEELARRLVAAGIADQPMEIFDTDHGMKSGTYRSFHAAAKWTYKKGTQPLRRARWHPYPENIDAEVPGEVKNRGESVSG